MWAGLLEMALFTEEVVLSQSLSCCAARTPPKPIYPVQPTHDCADLRLVMGWVNQPLQGLIFVLGREVIWVCPS
jgi:hypothetical protein